MNKNETNMENTNNSSRVPKLRFPGFDGEWGEKKLGEITEDVYQPQTISKDFFSKKGYPVYGANGIIGYYDKYNHETDQILVTCRGSSCGTINLSKGKCWITGNAMVVNLDKVEEQYDKYFFYYVFENADIRLVGKYIRLTIANYTSKENYENKLLDLSKVSLKGIYLSWSDLRLLNLENSNLKDAYLENTNMNNVNLTKANLEGTHLHGACLEAAKLIGVCLEGADFSSANLTGAKLIGVKFENANFNHANIVGTDFSKAI